MKLYTFRRCPYAIRARLALYAANIIPKTIIEVDLKNKPPSLIRHSPKGQVPVLVLTCGQVIDQSLDIMHYAISKANMDHWLALDAQHSQLLIKQNDEHFTPAVKICKYRHGDESDEQVYKALETIDAILSSWNRHLQNQPYFNGPSFGLTDAAIAPFVRQFAHITHNPMANSHHTAVKNWLDQILAMPLFAEVMRKHPIDTTPKSIDISD